MPGPSLSVRYAFVILFGIILSSGGAKAQEPQAASRITSPINNSVRITLQGNVHPLAQARYDQGAVPDSFPAQRILLLLSRAPERENALRQFLQDAHTIGSANYHKWVTPTEFGERFGPADSDIQAVERWLGSHGFLVAGVSKGKAAIEFSGTAGEIREAFHTEIHTYAVNGETHHANNSDPQIPAALAPVISGITPLNDFRPTSYIRVAGQAKYDPATHRITPEWTLPFGPAGLELNALTPGDFAVQYDLNPLYGAGINGTGITIGIIGASNVDQTVVAAYRSLFGLPPAKLNIIVDGNDPGENGAAVESFLDVEMAGAAAPGATVNLYTAADTDLQYGLNLAAQRAVDDDAAAVLSTSYGECEQDLGAAGDQFWAGVWEQAAAQGQTSFVSAGDGGSAGCDNFSTESVAVDGLAVSGFSSTPWNVSVGGTDFSYTSYNGTNSAQLTELGTYWDLAGTGLPNVSLLKRIPEQPWNEPFGLNIQDGGVFNPNASDIVAGSGGASSCISGTEAADGTFTTCTAGYAKPAWQTGKGIPSDNARDLPDVSLFAALDENLSATVICTFPGECVLTDGYGLEWDFVGGTSVSSPAMAGIMALVDQEFGRQGQANYVFYPLAAQHPAVFHSVSLGSNVVPCQSGSPNCALSTVSDNTKGYYTLGHYYAAAGYNQAAGLGSVDANLLVQDWNSLTFIPTNTVLGVSETTFAHGTPVNLSVTVSGAGGTPSGDVSFVTTASPSASTGLSDVTLAGGTAAATVNNLPGGQYTLTARYAGDDLFAAGDSNSVALDVAPEASTLAVSGATQNALSGIFSPISGGASYPIQTNIIFDAQPRGVSAAQGSLDGIPTGSVTFTDSASSGTVSSGPIPLNANGLAEWVPAAGLPVGTHSVSAIYSGDASFSASSSTVPLTFSITKGIPLVDLTSGGAYYIASGVPPGVFMGVFAGGSVVRPTGTVTFYVGGNPVETDSIIPGCFDFGYGCGADATLKATNLPLGVDTITASYSGDANYSPVTSSPLSIDVEQNPNLTASVSPASINEGQSFTVTANVPGVVGQPPPPASVLYSAFGTQGSASGPAPLVNGVATFTLPGSELGIGSVIINVTAGGDNTYGTVSVTLSGTVTAPFALSATPVNISPGATAGNASTVTITPENGFTGTIYFTCQLGTYPPGAQPQHLPTCAVPNSATVTGSSVVTVPVTITSAAPTSAWAPLLSPQRPGRWAGVAVSTVLALFLVGLAARHRRWRLAAGLVVVAVLTSANGCGGGSAGSGPSGPTVPGTTAGTYTFTLFGALTQNLGTAAAPSFLSEPQVVTVTVTVE